MHLCDFQLVVANANDNRKRSEMARLTFVNDNSNHFLLHKYVFFDLREY
jgi:hypothetical protein